MKILRNRHLARTALAAASVAAILPLLSGCGGSGGAVTSSAAAPDSGRATITILWPAVTAPASRLVPAAANCVVVSFLSSDGKTVIQSQTIVRPGRAAPARTRSAGGSFPSTATFSNLPQGSLLVSATAYPSTDGSGVAEATATAPITIVAGNVVPISLTMATTITSVAISPTNPAFNGTPVTLTATAYDAAQDIVLSDAWSWTDTDPQVVSIVPSGNVAVATAVGVGTTKITVTETESGQSASGTVVIGGG